MQALVSEPTATYGETTTPSLREEFPTQKGKSSSIYFSRLNRFPENIAEMFQKLNRLSHLSENWDSYSAEPPSPASIAEARTFLIENHMIDLPFYFLAPGVKGEVMLEFQKESKAAELYFLPTGQNELILFKDDEVELEGNLKENFRKLIDFFQSNP